MMLIVSEQNYARTTDMIIIIYLMHHVLFTTTTFTIEFYSLLMKANMENTGLK